MKIKVFHNNQPCLAITHDTTQNADFGINRDRCPDSGWGEFRNTRIGCGYDKDVELTPELKKILIEDICEYFNGENAYKKLVELDLIK